MDAPDNQNKEQLQQFFTAYLENNLDAVLFISPSGKLLHLNDSACALFSWQLVEVMHCDFTSLCRQYHYQVPLSPLLDALATFRSQEVFTQLLNDQGQCFDITWQVIPLPGEDAQGMVLIGRDVTELNTVKNQAQNMEVVIDNLIAHVPVSIYWKDLNGVYMGCNQFVLRMAGLSSYDQIIGKTDYDLVWKDIADITREVDLDVIRTGKIKKLEESGNLADGSWVCFMSSKLPMKDKEGNTIGIVGLSLDITDRKKIEEELVAIKAKEVVNRTKTEFIANMSHDLRTPLVAICGTADLLKGEKVFTYEEVQRIAEDLSSSGKILLNLIENILDFSRLSPQEKPPFYETIDLRELVESTVHGMSDLANQKQVKLIIRYNEECPRYVVCDPHRLSRILTNLLANALKFTDEGHILVSVELMSQSNDRVELQISVEDTGIGISSDKIEEVFECFPRAEPTYIGRYRGAGLGLNITKQFVESLGGAIAVNSQLGQGATFFCSLPFHLPNMIEMKSQWARHYTRIRILLVDDYQARGKQLVNQLSLNPCELISSDELFSRLKAAKQEKRPYEIVIIDDDIKQFKPEK